MKTRRCVICNTDKPMNEIVRMYEIKGEKCYLCKDCHEDIRNLPNDYEMHHQF